MAVSEYYSPHNSTRALSTIEHLCGPGVHSFP